jgi:catechol 2,3-dioxygenase-like lactoylglutathione lyase family enzyme
MAIRHMDHVGIIVDDLDAAVAFFVALGMTADPVIRIEGEWAGRVNGIPGSRVELVGVHSPDRGVWLEVTRFVTPADDREPDGAPSNRRGIRHVAFIVDDVETAIVAVGELGYQTVNEVVDYQDAYRLCYIRGPDGIIVELAEELAGRD